jgi:anti-sigma factor RsiW
MSDHGTFDEMAVGYALHALEPEDEAVFAVHLPTCPRCAATVAETGEVMAALAADLPAAEPPDEVRIRRPSSGLPQRHPGRGTTTPGPRLPPRLPPRSGHRSGVASSRAPWSPQPSPRSWGWASGTSSSPSHATSCGRPWPNRRPS